MSGPAPKIFDAGGGGTVITLAVTVMATQFYRGWRALRVALWKSTDVPVGTPRPSDIGLDIRLVAIALLQELAMRGLMSISASWLDDAFEATLR